MAASADRQTREKSPGRTRRVAVYTGTTIYAGTMVAANATGYAVPATASAAVTVLGIAQEQVVNSGGSGAKDILVGTGVAALKNGATYPVAQADIGRICYVEDDQTVQDERGGAACIAGIVDSIDPVSGEVWVAHFDESSVLAAANVAAMVAALAHTAETVTSGACDPAKTTLISCTGTKAYTLADGAVAGLRKFFLVTVVASTPFGTLTPATSAGAATYHFGAVGEWLLLEWQTGGWILIASHLSYAAAETVTTGAISLFTRVSYLSCTGTIAYTLADGLFLGQRKTLHVSAVASTPVGTVTVATYLDGTAEVLHSVGEFMELEWTIGGWKLLAFNLARMAGDTVTAGAISVYTPVTKLSCTDTKAYTLANGRYSGQIKFVRCSAVSGSPAGTITPAAVAGFATATFSAVYDGFMFIWNGAAWECGGVFSVGTTAALT